MTAPIASLFAAPLDTGGPGVAPAVGPAADTDGSFAALVSALFDSAEGSPSAASSTPQTLSPQPQTPQTNDATGPEIAANPNLAAGDSNVPYPVQPAPAVSTATASSGSDTFVSSAPDGSRETVAQGTQRTPPVSKPPLASSQTTHAISPRQAPLGKAVTAFADEGPLNLAATPASAGAQNEILANPPAQTTPVLETETDSSTVHPSADPESQSANPEPNTPAAAVGTNSPPIRRQDKPAPSDDEQKQPRIDLSSSDLGLSLVAQPLAPLVAQLLAQLGTQQPRNSDQSVDPTSAQEAPEKSGVPQKGDVPDAPTDNNFAPSDSAPMSLPAAALPSPDGLAELASLNTASMPSQSNLPATIVATTEPPKSAEAAKPEHLSSNTGAAMLHGNVPADSVDPAVQQTDTVSAGKDAPRAGNSTTAQPMPATADATAFNRPDDSSPAVEPDASVAVNHQTATAAPNPDSVASKADKDSASDDQPSATPASSDAKAENISDAASQPSVTVQTPVDAVTHPAVPVARDAAGAISPDSGHPALPLRATRTPMRSGSAINRDASESQVQSPTSSAPDFVSGAEKPEPMRPTDLVQDRDLSKIDPKPASHLTESASDTDPAKAQQPPDLAPAAESPQPQANRIEAAPTPPPPQFQPAPFDLIAPTAASTHGLEIPLVHAGASHDQDVPVRLAFNAPNMPDSSAFDALALKIASHSSDGDSRFSIRLDPPELGKIEVNLNVDAHGHAQAELTADKPQTLELLQKDSSVLERALKDAGLNLSGGLAFSLKGDGRSQAWRDSQNGRSRSLQIGATDAAGATAALSTRAALAAHAYGLPTSQLDIRV